MVIGAHHATLGTLHACLRYLRNSLEGSISGAEEEHGSPVVGKVLGELATGTGREAGEIVVGVVHGHIERILKTVSGFRTEVSCGNMGVLLR